MRIEVAIYNIGDDDGNENKQTENVSKVVILSIRPICTYSSIL